MNLTFRSVSIALPVKLPRAVHASVMNATVRLVDILHGSQGRIAASSFLRFAILLHFNCDPTLVQNLHATYRQQYMTKVIGYNGLTRSDHR